MLFRPLIPVFLRARAVRPTSQVASGKWSSSYDRDIDRLTVETVMSHTVMSHEAETKTPGIPVSAAIMIMFDREVDRLAILHAKPAPQRPAGLLSLSDIIQDMAGER